MNPVTAAPADDGDGLPGVEVIARGLNGPRELQRAPWGTFSVAEADTGRIVQVEPWNGAVSTIADGFATPQGVALTSRGDHWVVTAGPPPAAEAGEASGPVDPPYPSASLLRVARWGGNVS
ncbi:MAG: hypothetical protein OEY23_18825, partial [Acidimicrobiia bacterium]|nr:hypothetical protein [Acidimicrobiia bacterium]